MTSFGVAVQPRLLEDVRAHREVREPVAAGIRAVRADAADLGGEVEHELGFGVAEQPRGVVHRREVVVGAARDDDLVAVGLEPLDEVRAEEAAAAGDEDLAHGVLSGVPVDEPVDAADPALAVLGVPADRLRGRLPPTTRCGSQPVSAVSFSWPTRSAITSLAPGRYRDAVETTSRPAGQKPSSSPTRRMRSTQSRIEMFSPWP